MTERPVTGSVLSLSGSVFMFAVGGSALSHALSSPTVLNVLTYTIELTAGIVVAVCAILAAAFPEEHRVLGYLIAAFSLASFFGTSGAFCFGSLLGVFGAAVILIWSPAVPRTCPNCGSPMRAWTSVCRSCETIVPVAGVYRPSEATATALSAVFFVHIATALGAIGPYPLRKFPPLELLPGVVAEAALLLAAVMLYRRPGDNRLWGGVLISAALIAIIGPYYGFILGPLLGLAAGAMAIRWKAG